FRLTAYQPLAGSMGDLDTGGYINTAKISFPSWAFFTGVRAPTLPLVMKLLQPKNGYPAFILSQPAVLGNHPTLAVLPGFDWLVIFQTIVSILCWGALAWTLFRHLNNILAQVSAVLLIFLFAFCPQMVDWDQLLLSESLSYSLYALLLALTIEFVFQISRLEKRANWKIIAVTLALFCAITAWIFVRDTNSFLIPISILLALPLFYFLIRNRTRLLITIALMVSLIGIYIFQQTAFQASQRWLQPFLNNMTANVFPSSSRVAFFVQRGMPVSGKLLTLRGSEEYNGITKYADFMSWAQKKGYSTYISFLISNPFWASLTVYNQLDTVFGENLQPYFGEDPHTRPAWLVPIGDMLHPLSNTVILIDFFLALLLFYIGIRSRDPHAFCWAWIAAWLFISSVVLMALGITGEVRSIIRHAMVGVVPLRLALWIFLPVLADRVLSNATVKDSPAQPISS
ncbi:MAG TPA: hypothetical protein VKF38_01880, partial [Anaerolineaceae bacterium]|nr:hypothetical protein [Anaerolineaceae bacterium]